MFSDLYFSKAWHFNEKIDAFDIFPIMSNPALSTANSYGFVLLFEGPGVVVVGEGGERNNWMVISERFSKILI